MIIKILKKIYITCINIIRKIKVKFVIYKTKKAHFVYGLNSVEDRNTKIIISLTSYRKRFSTLPLCLKSIFNQTVKADKIILYIAEKDSKFMTEEILDLIKYGLEIKYVHGDLRPHKKYYYSMQEFPNAIIITLDDDVIYSSDLVEELLKVHKKFPNTIIAARARKINYNSNGFSPYRQWEISQESERPSNSLLATGVGGVLYPPRLIYGDLLFNTNYINEYLPVDDLWLKTVEIIKNVKTVICNPEIDKKRIEIPIAQKVGLGKKNVMQNQNDYFLKKLNNQFNLISRMQNNRKDK